MGQINILHLSNTNLGGAGSSAYNIHYSMLLSGYNSKFLISHTTNPNENVYVLKKSINYYIGKLLSKLFRPNKLDQNFNFNNFYEHSSLYSAKDILASIPDFTPDYIILHWVNHINSKTIQDLQRLTNAPIIWILSDSGALTGGCHSVWDCKGYTSNCGQCPGLKSNRKRDLSFLNLKKKYKHLKETDLTILAGSGRLYNQTKESRLFREKTIKQIFATADSKIYCPIANRIPPVVWNIPRGNKIIFAGAAFLDEKRKGFNYLLSALKAIPQTEQENYTLILAGKASKELLNNLPDNCVYIGELKTPAELARAYQASDLFACPSIEDPGPMMIIESLMCGTPVVAFDMGYAPDFVHRNKTGYRAELKNINDFADGIREILSLEKHDYDRLRETCRDYALEKCHSSAQLKIIESCLK